MKGTFDAWDNTLCHYGKLGMKWGIKLGPPYPLSEKAKGVNNIVNQMKGIKYKEFSTLMSTKMVETSKSGSCHDQVNYEVSKLREIGIEPEVTFLIESNKKGQGGTTHSLVSFELNGKTYWLENAWGGMEGLHSYSNKKSMINDIKAHWDKKSEYPFLYSGNLNPDQLKTGMSLQEILDIVDFN